MAQSSRVRARGLRNILSCREVNGYGARVDHTYALTAIIRQYGVHTTPYDMEVANWNCDFEEVDLGLAKATSNSLNWHLKAQVEVLNKWFMIEFS